MAHYMAELILTGRPVLVIGGGQVAQRKLRGLMPSGACITVVAPHLSDEIAQLVTTGQLEHWAEPFTPTQLEPHWSLIFAATGDGALNRQIALLCAEKGYFCNSADGPEVSGFIVPAVVRRGDVTVAVSTGGLSPSLSRLLKERIEAWLEPGWGELAQLFGAMRQTVLARIPHAATRYRFWRHIALAAQQEQRFNQQTDSRAWFENKLDRHDY
ncbi:precorrin-2 dehydrogenase [Magnetococcus marinus MC-1]|uniref:precorrin-2 dehydrogenase n=1 Tax=Magnetococcus marinus (strain ATCC BAA-1437 / JCM 17883 / MC-1) TaxID=156889 RepID=A0LDQ9_MAGMM|nr:bifunctional precorrin-2 dehydrogenase/sirohydrochlorin ferrochelatase [Magnetococcus marinus]ABK46102.1 precorrin-2 dehydrogenase [Magnetococcus marinus MC-1]